MYNKRTVFVIGAGCSHEFKLPLGAELRDHLYSAIMNGDSGVVGEAIRRVPLPDANMDVNQRMAAFASGLHSKPSIDQYLHFHRADEWSVMLGKCAIAATILERERDSGLKRDMLAGGMLSVGGTWLMKLFHGMNADTDLSTVENLFRNVSFICFNYDRCIEVGFFNAIRFLTGAPLARVAEVMRHLNIWHPYGTVGALDYEAFGRVNAALGLPGETIYYGDDTYGRENPLLGFPNLPVRHGEVLAGARLLRTFTQGMDDEKMLVQMRRALAAAEQIVYLGFSFLDQNMELLTTVSEASSSRIYATAYELSPPDKARAEWAMAEASRRPAMASSMRRNEITVLNATASQFFDHYGNTLRR
jgi:hypothetical protein